MIIQEEANPVIRECNINLNKYQAVWVVKNCKGTVENCNLIHNLHGTWNIDTGCRIIRIGNKE